MRRNYRFVMILMFLMAATAVVAQRTDSIKVSGNFDNAPVLVFIEEIEKQAGVYFYFDSRELDSIRVTAAFTNVTLPAALSAALGSQGVFYSFYEDGYVFLSRKEEIYTDISRKPVPAANTAAVPGGENGARTAPKNTPTASLENKIYVVGDKNARSNSGTATIDGYVRDAKDGEPITGAVVQISALKIITATDRYGYYSITVPKGRHNTLIQSIGMIDAERTIEIVSDGSMSFELRSEATTLKSVTITGQKVSNVKGTQMGMQKLDIKVIRQVPVVFGEADVLRVVTTLPGVKTVGEASTGLNVRGGSADQNMILFNDATIYNPTHFFGMFSAFNPDIVKDVTLYKSSMPARLGGRLSSVLDISGREGNKKNFAGSAGLGLLTSRLTIEGPLVKEKSSFIVGARSTYANWMLKLLPDDYKKSRAAFYDLNLHVSHEINKKNSIYITGYYSTDRFNLNSDTTFSYSNRNVSLKWKHIFSNKMNAVFIAGYDGYEYSLSSDRNPVTAHNLRFHLEQYNFRANFNYYLNPKNTIDYGLSVVNYRYSPGAYRPVGDESLAMTMVLPVEQGLESALYLSDRYDPSPSLSIEGGVRYSIFNAIGPRDVNEYAPGVPKSPESVMYTRSYEKGKFINTYGGPEIRFSVRQMLGMESSLKAAFNTQRQYVHLISNTATMAPTDVWKLSDPNIRPQFGSQVSLGYYRNFKSNVIETSLEVYYKSIHNYLDFRSGARLVLNPTLETDVIATRGKAYGAELLIKKLTGKLNGWVGYTWSRVFLKQDDPDVGEVISGGNYYPANYDKPHDVTAIANYRINQRFSLSLNATYSTGRPITVPIARFYYSGSQRTLYSDRNTFRIPDYFRADFAMNLEGNHKVHQRAHNSWTVGVYNLTGRRNPYSVYFASERGYVNGYRLSIFGSAIPYISFNTRFR